MKNKAILLVEDNADDVDLTLRAFARADVTHQVIVKRSGLEALEYLHGRTPGQTRLPARPLPAVALLDLKLPLLDGFEVLRRIRQHPATRVLPIVVLTSSRERDDILTSYALGANSYICKPVRSEEFVKVVTELGLYWLILNEAPTAAASI